MYKRQDVDTVLETAVAALQGTTTGSVREGGALAIGDSVDLSLIHISEPTRPY